MRPAAEPILFRTVVFGRIRALRRTRDGFPPMPVTIRDCYADGRFGLSIEIFPPKTPEADVRLEKSLAVYAGLNPDFVSCTYGAGGSTRDKTIGWCGTIQNDLHTTATAHFTCVGSTREELLEWLDRASAAGVRNIMALRGDPPRGEESFQQVDGGLRYANELVALIKQRHPEMGIGVAGYPEVHQEARNAEIDLANLVRKVDAGADAVYTQLFFVNDHFLRFRDRCEAAGITVPIVPGLMPITDYDRIERITAMCGTDVPRKLTDGLLAARGDKQAGFEVGVEFAVEQTAELVSAGVPGVHLYGLNQTKGVVRIVESLGLSPDIITRAA